jgi:hypothetical protein
MKITGSSQGVLDCLKRFPIRSRGCRTLVEQSKGDLMKDDARRFLADIDLAAAIDATMHFYGIPSGVTVEVSEAVVKLEGEVDDAHQREAAELVARRFDGVASVVNVIAVRRHPKSVADRPASE